MSDARRIAKNIIFLSAGQFIWAILAVFFVAMVARLLGPEEYGIYAFAQSLVVIIAILMVPGFKTVAVREVAKKKELAHKYFSNMLLLKLGLGFIAFIIFFLVLEYLDYPSNVKLVAYLFGGQTLIISLTQSVRYVFQAFERLEFESFLRVLTKSMMIFFGLTVLFLGFGLPELAIAIFASSLLVFLATFIIIFWKFLPLKKPELDLVFCKQFIIEAFPFAAIAILTALLGKINVLMLSFLLQEQAYVAIAYFSAPQRLLEGLSILPGLFTTAIFPAFSRYFEASQVSFRKLYYFSIKSAFLLALPVTIGLFFLARKVVLLVFADAYLESIPVFQILIWAFIFSFLGAINARALWASGKQNIFLYSLLGTVIVTVSLNFILIPILGVVGAALAALAGTALNFIFTFTYCQWKVSRLISVFFIPKTILAVLPMTLFLYFFSDWSLLLTIPLAGLLYVPLAYVLKAIDEQDLALLKKIISHQKND